MPKDYGRAQAQAGLLCHVELARHRIEVKALHFSMVSVAAEVQNPSCLKPAQSPHMSAKLNTAARETQLERWSV